MAKDISLKLTGFDKLQEILEPGAFPRKLRKHVRKATKKNALIAEGEIKSDISAGKFKPNAPLTAALKGSGKPLVDSGELFASIVSEDRRWDTALVGVLKNVRKRDKAGKFIPGATIKVASILHSGATIKVTEKMRRYMAAMARKDPKHFRPIKPGTRVIVIPARPFLESAVKDKMVRKYQNNWADAIQKAMTQKR